MHLGQSANRSVPTETEIIKALSSVGFGVAGMDTLADQYGPGVDYFHDSDKNGAEQVAAALSTLRPPTDKPIEARKPKAKNQVGVLGV